MHYFFKVRLQRYQGSSQDLDDGVYTDGQLDVVLSEEEVDGDACNIILPFQSSLLAGEYKNKVEIYDLHPDLADEGALLATKQQRTVLVPPEWSGQDLRSLLLRHAPHRDRDSKVHVGHRRQHSAEQAVKVSVSLASRALANATSVISVLAEGLSLGAEYLVRVSLIASCAEGCCKRDRTGERHLSDRLFVSTDKQWRSKLLTWDIKEGSEGLEPWVGSEAPNVVTIVVRIADCFPRR